VIFYRNIYQFILDSGRSKVNGGWSLMLWVFYWVIKFVWQSLKL